jgi:hypothetical protein
MSLDSSPLSPRPTPLLHPTDPVPGRMAALIGGGISVALAALIVFVTLRLGTQIVFLPAGLNANANAFAIQLQQVQGFSDYWTHSYDVNGFRGYDDTTANQKIMQDEVNSYHMNLVVITITADVVQNTGTDVIFSPKDPNFSNDIDTYPDATYVRMVHQAQAAGLTPVFRLDVRVVQDLQNNNYANTTIGSTWADSQQLSIQYETAWFNSYTRFAVYYAIMARKLGVPLMIIGSDLAFIATDNPLTGLSKTPKANQGGDPGVKCYGRRDCEWRHVINAMHSAMYKPLGSKRPTTGGDYSGRLTFAATVYFDPTGNSSELPTPEWSTITFWDDLDVIGIDAFFPLTNGITEPSVPQLTEAWHGQLSAGQSPNGTPTNIVSALQQFAVHSNKQILFTAAGYESVSGCTSNPGTDTTGTTEDDTEQFNDMTALIKVFASENWWLGVIWSADYPVWPRTSLTKTDSANNAGLLEYTYATNTEWAGKSGGGLALKQLYTSDPLNDALWANL